MNHVISGLLLLLFVEGCIQTSPSIIVNNSAPLNLPTSHPPPSPNATPLPSPSATASPGPSSTSIFIPTVPIGSSVVQPAPGTPVLVIHADTSLTSHFMGIGIQWDPYTLTQQNLILSRVSFLKPSFLRVMFRVSDFYQGDDSSGNPLYNFNSSTFINNLYGILNYSKTNQIDVVIGVWDASPLSASDPKLITVMNDLLNTIVMVKGYTQVKYVNLINEPNGSWSLCPDQATWTNAITQLRYKLSSSGISVQIIGPDIFTDGGGVTLSSSDSMTWFNGTVNHLSAAIGSYEIHQYAEVSGNLVNGLLEQQFLSYRQIINSHDSANKPFFIGEAGMVTDKQQPDTQPDRYLFSYGVWMADYAIQVIRAGLDGVSAWDLDDAMHAGGGYGSADLKGWGFFNSLAGSNNYPASDMNLRPWFYTWSLISRNFPRGSVPLSVPSSNLAGVRIAAAKVPSAVAGKYYLSIAAVNDSNQAQTVTLKIPEATDLLQMAQYNYFSNQMATDSNGFAIPVSKNNYYLATGVSVSLPSQGVVILTSKLP